MCAESIRHELNHCIASSENIIAISFTFFHPSKTFDSPFAGLINKAQCQKPNCREKLLQRSWEIHLFASRTNKLFPTFKTYAHKLKSCAALAAEERGKKCENGFLCVPIVVLLQSECDEMCFRLRLTCEFIAWQFIRCEL